MIILGARVRRKVSVVFFFNSVGVFCRRPRNANLPPSKKCYTLQVLWSTKGNTWKIIWKICNKWLITLHLVPCWITAFPVCIVINNTMLHLMRETFSCGLLLRFTLFQTASSWAWKFYSLSYATIQTRPSNGKGNQPICKNSVNNNSPKLRFIKLLKPTSISEKTIKSIFFLRFWPSIVYRGW